MAGVIAWLVWPSTPASPARERHYRAATACLLTDEKGLAGEQAEAAWAGMQEASIATLIKVQYLSVSGPQTPANALAYFNSLALQECTAIIAVGEIPVAAMVNGHSRFPEVRYVAIGSKTDDSAITNIEATSLDAVQAATRTIVSK